MNFKDLIALSLDKDLADLLIGGRVNSNEVMQLQMLRILRGKPFNVELNGPKTSLEGWSADGIKWVPTQPGNGTGVGE